MRLRQLRGLSQGLPGSLDGSLWVSGPSCVWPNDWLAVCARLRIIVELLADVVHHLQALMIGQRRCEMLSLDTTFACSLIDARAK